MEEVASRVALLKGRLANQKVSVKLDHDRELDCVRTRFAEFKHRIQQLEGAADQHLARIQQYVDLAWEDLIQSVNTLIGVIH